jgi:hypothetical protein
MLESLLHFDIQHAIPFRNPQFPREEHYYREERVGLADRHG